MYIAMSENVLGKIMKQARGPWGLVGLEEPPSQRKVHYLVMKGLLFKNKLHLLKQKIHYYNYTIRGHRNSLADSAAARLNFHPQLIKNSYV